MGRTFYAHVKVVPKHFPEHITLIYRPANPETNAFLGEQFEVDRSWDQIRSTFLITPEDFAEREGYLKAGDAANMGFHHVSVEVEG
jgi:hypothetical protein